MRPPFDRVYCVSLPRSTDRREHAARELASVGLGDFTFFDATDQDDPLVAEYRGRDAVATFPPCFRCGQRICDCPNNVLLDSQVATFITFKRMWEGIVRDDVSVALVVEDDIKFTDYALALISTALTPVNLTACGMTRDHESLLRLGWARTTEHTWTGEHRFVSGAIRMSNPAFALTNAFARKLLRTFRRIECTVDTFIHKRVGPEVNNHTLLPPLAYELSWSTGAFPSLIRPKPIHAEYLRKTRPKDDVAIEEAERNAAQRFRIEPYNILCVGHPRCGSAYMAHLLTAFGLDVGHERLGASGISSWMFAADDDPYPFARNRGAELRRDKHFAAIIHHVRNPADAIPSIMVENRHSTTSYEFRRRHLRQELGLDLDAATTELERAVLTYLGWNRLITRLKPNLVVQVEACEEQVREFLMDQRLLPADATIAPLPPKDSNTQKRYQGQVIAKPKLQRSDWAKLAPNILASLRQFCLQYGYPEIKLT